MDTLIRHARTIPSAAVRPRIYRWLAAALLFSAAVVVAARLWSDTLQRIWPTSDPTLEGLQFGSFLILVGGLLAWRWGGDAGLQLGSTLREWRAVVTAGAGLGLLTWTFVTLTGSNPYSDADPLFEMVLVPVGEELVFRGLLLGWLLSELSARYAQPTAVRAAVAFSAVAFGAAHASNALFGAGDFALVQVVAATALGIVFGALRVRTESLLAPITLHAVVNGINLLA